MKLIDAINKMKYGSELPELTVWDTDYDMESYFYKNEGTDKFDRAMNKIASALNVIEEKEKGVVVDLSSLISRHLSELSDLFIRSDIDSIMDCIESVFSGNVSEEWMSKFADILAKE